MMSRNFVVPIVLLFVAELASCMDSEEYSRWEGSFFFDEAFGCATALVSAGVQTWIADLVS